MLSSKYEAEHDSSGAGVVPGESGDKVKDIRDTLRREGYDVQQLTGKSLMKQLREITRHTWTEPKPRESIAFPCSVTKKP